MRRESSTVIVLAGEPDDSLLSALSQSPNVSVARAPAPARPAAGESPAPARPAWEAGALALREAARRRSTYVIVPDDPLADVAAAWRAMWAGLGGPDAVAGFELAAGTALAAWRDKQFELSDYYLVMAPAPGSPAGPEAGAGGAAAAPPGPARPGAARPAAARSRAAALAAAAAGPGPGPAAGGGPDLYLGPLAAVRPRRVAVVVRAEHPGDRAAGLLDSLRGLEPGPWWPPLGELIDTARNFFAGGLTHPRLASI